MDISQKGKGAIPAPLAIRDYRLELAMAPTYLPSQFSVKDKIVKVKDQNGSGSCVGQAFSYYAEVLNNVETGEKVQLSARDLYSLIYVEPMGAYLKDAASKICNTGVILEKDAPSYENGNPPSEQFMRNRKDITKEEEYNGYVYVSKRYVTWDKWNLTQFKQAILAGNGAVSSFAGTNAGWGVGQVTPPDVLSQAEWWHCVYLVGWDDEKKAFQFVNSWGEGWGDKGFGWLPYSYIEKGFASNPVTLIDLPNDTYTKLLSQLVNLYTKIISLLKKK